MEGAARDSMAVHYLCGILSRHSGPGATVIFVFWLADDWSDDAGMADGVNRSRVELRGVRVASLSRGSGGNSTRTVGSFLPSGDEPTAGVSPHHSAAGFSHCPAADDERLRIVVQRYFDGLCDFGLGIGHRVS